MTKNWKRLLCGSMAVALAVVLAVPAVAAAYKKTIDVNYGIGLQYNGVDETLTDVNGKVVEPFVYEGTTYVPIRGVSYLFGASVGYDQKNNKAVIYDDFAEACAIVNEINDVANSGYEIILGEYYEGRNGAKDAYVTGYPFSNMVDYTARYNAWYERAYHIYDVINELKDDNANIEIIQEEILPYYTDFVTALIAENGAYDNLRDYKNSYWSGLLTSSANSAIQKYKYLSVSTSNFFDDYCTWRDLGF